MSTTFTYLSRGLSAEALKLKNTMALWLAVLAPLSILGMVFLAFYFRGDRLIAPGSNPWLLWARNNFNIVAQLLAPLYLALLTAMVNSIEHTGHGWKQLYALPFPKGVIYLNKYLMVMGLTLLSYVVFWAGMLLGGELLGWVKPALGFQYYSMLVAITLTACRIFLASLFILTCQFCLSYRFRSFALSMGLGILFTITYLVATRWEYIGYYPYSWPAMAAQEQGHRLFTQPVWLSLGSTLVMLALGGWDSVRRNVA